MRQYRNIVLTGFMGTGKSTIGRMLAARLGLKLIDTDALITQSHGPIPLIFEEYGESGFRDIERAVGRDLATYHGHVISTGGRFMLDEQNAELLSRDNRVFCLVADLEVIVERVLRKPERRPMLQVPNPRERVIELLEERAEGYARFESVHSDAGPPHKVVDDIVSRLE